MQSILGIDTAWTARQPSGVALIEGEPGAWRVVCAAPSYEAFVASCDGVPVDWTRTRFAGSQPRVAELIGAARRASVGELAVVAVDMPVARVPFESRRAADAAVSRAFARNHCSTHSPSAERPGALGRSLMTQLETHGFPLATAQARYSDALPCTIEVYPHPAILRLLGRERRLKYKVSRSRRYWPMASRSERISKLIEAFRWLNDGLGEIFGAPPVSLPALGEVDRLSMLKKYEDVLDAVVCAWVGACFVEGAIEAYGDDLAAIWVPSARGGRLKREAIRSEPSASKNDGSSSQSDHRATGDHSR